jgi:thimet oligopeptidase
MTPHDRFTRQCQDDLARARQLLAEIKATPSPGVASVLEPYNEAYLLVADVGARANLMTDVHPDGAMRDAGESCMREVVKLDQDRLLDRELYAALAAVPTDGLDASTQRLLHHTLRDYRRAGVDKDDATRARLKALADEAVETGLTFDRQIREDVRRVSLDPAELAGLPADYVAAHPPGPDGKVELSTDYPDYQPFRAYAESGDARRRFYLAYTNRGYPQNEEVFRKLLAAREETARLLGFASFADYITADKMIGSAGKAQAFIDQIATLAAERARADVAALLARKQKDDPSATRVEDFDRGYYEELVKREQHGFDAQSARPYFPFGPTRDGLLLITARVFDVAYEKVTDAELWHADVECYDVWRHGAKLGRIYLDLHPRENKYKHAAMFPIRAGVRGRQLPEAALVCNFPDPRSSSGPALMDHEDVVTMFHEFGHLMHHVLGGQQRWAAFAGIATESDFVEAPSQMLEEWAWDPSTLALFARHVETGEVIPAELVARMRAADEFGKGVQARHQMFYASLSLRLHSVDPAALDLLATTVELQGRYSPFPTVEGAHFYASFGHLNGYSAMYYTYMWSLVIARDLLSEFQKNGLLDAETARRYAAHVLAPGGSKDAAELCADFLGRPYSFEAYQRWLDQG